MQTVVPMRDTKHADTTPGELPAAAARPAPRPAPVAAATPARSAFWPLLLGLAALTLWLGYQAWQLDKDRRQLQAAQAEAAPRIEAAAQLRRSLDLLAADTQRLADAGNGNARVLVDELRRRGITINPAAPATGTANAPAVAPVLAPATATAPPAAASR